MRRFAVFFKQNYLLVVGVAERRLSSRPDAEEVATEAFRIAWEKYREGSEITLPWLYGIVRNVIGNEYRSRERRAAVQSRLIEQLLRHPPEHSELYSEVRDIVDRLPPAARAVLLMTYWEGLSADETAARLGVSAGAVRARLQRARALLRAELDAVGESADAGAHG